MTAVDDLDRALMRKPIIDTMDEGRLSLIAAKVSSGRRAVTPTRAELNAFLELADKYDLDIFANEIWLSKTQGRDGGDGTLLIMVGRDGLRKIARRNDLDIDSDVVREKDVFRVIRTPDRQRLIHHEYEGGTEEARGRIVGAWCEVWDKGSGRQMGYFFAPIDEYKPGPGPKLQYSPWSSQESIMISTAAERSALRQATPLAGLLGEGEDARIGGGDSGFEQDALRQLIMDLDAPLDVREGLWDAIDRLNRLSPNAWGLGRAQMTLPGQSVPDLLTVLEQVQTDIEREERRKGLEPAVAGTAEEVEPAAVKAAVEPAEEEKHAGAEKEAPPEGVTARDPEERRRQMEADLLDLESGIVEAQDRGDEEQVAELEARAAAIRAEIE